MEYVFPVVFLLIWGTFMLAMLGGMALVACALISAARIQPEAFGPWWDNTKTAWILGLALSFVVPFGTLVTGIYWFRTGRPAYRRSGAVCRPFWTGPPKPPPPYQPPPGYPPPPGYQPPSAYPQPPGSQPPPGYPQPPNSSPPPNR